MQNLLDPCIVYFFLEKVISDKQWCVSKIRWFHFFFMKISNFYGPYQRFALKSHMCYTSCTFFQVDLNLRSQSGKNEEKKIFEKNAFKVSGQRGRYRLPFDVFSCQIYNFANFTIKEAAFYSGNVIKTFGKCNKKNRFFDCLVPLRGNDTVESGKAAWIGRIFVCEYSQWNTKSVWRALLYTPWSMATIFLKIFNTKWRRHSSTK